MLQRYGITYLMVRANEKAESYIELRVDRTVADIDAHLVELIRKLATVQGYDNGWIETLEELQEV